MSKKEKKPEPKMKTFLTPGYIKELDTDLYGVFRNVEVEEKDKRTGRWVREKLQELGPLGKPLREARKGEEAKVVLRSHHPITNLPLDLVEDDQ